jgi:hypothetical protein
MKKFLKFISVALLAVFFAIVLTGCTTTSNYITVKYRDDQVDIANSRWEKLDTTGSSIVNGSWYDSQNKYMIINLSGTYYHYCSLPPSTWSSFKKASSFGSYYNSNIKGKYDCRVNPVPNY